jgi:hypothetical protein
MSNWTMAVALGIALGTSFPGFARAADDAALLKDMTAVIALLGQPCGQVVSVVTKSENDHVATCKDGNRYRVYVNAAGRVVAEKQ